MFHLAGWSEDIDPAGLYNLLNAIADTQITWALTNIQVPSLNQIVALAGGAENTAEPIMRMVAPSLRTRSLFQISPLNTGAAAHIEPDTPPKILDLRRTPLVMVPGENVQVELNSNPAAVQWQWCFAWFADGPIAPVGGSIFTVRAVGATALVAGTWTNVPLVFDENLPRGRYQIVGMKAISAECQAARLVVPDSRWRPGVLGCDTVTDVDWKGFRYGNFGVFGEFEDTDALTVDFHSSAADAAEIVYLDLIQLRAGPG
jgi:hypothetical protein